MLSSFDHFSLSSRISLLSLFFSLISLVDVLAGVGEEDALVYLIEGLRP